MKSERTADGLLVTATGSSEKEALFNMMRTLEAIHGSIQCNLCDSKVPLIDIDNSKCPECGWDAVNDCEVEE